MLKRSGMAAEMDDPLLFTSVRSGIRTYRVWRNSMRKSNPPEGEEKASQRGVALAGGLIELQAVEETVISISTACPGTPGMLLINGLTE